MASNEYSKVVRRDHLPAGTTVVDCVFLHDGRIVSTYAKQARGLMVRYAASVKVRFVVWRATHARAEEARRPRFGSIFAGNDGGGPPRL